MKKIKVGVLGIGVIAGSTYLPAISKMENVEMVAVCDLIEERAVNASIKYNVPHVFVDQRDMLELDIDLVVNLTNIQAHFDTNLMSLQAGKHVYSEKTFAGNAEEATILIEEAKKYNVRLGAAAATMLSPVNLKIAELLRNDAIGKVNFVVAHHSHFGAASFEGWTTDPTWFYQPGAGPLVDLGVYALHTLTGLLGPAKAVCALSGISVPVRTVRSGPAKGKQIHVEMDDNTLIMLDFGQSTFAYVDSTYTVHATKGPRTQFFGSKGTIAVNERGAEHPLSVYQDDWGTGLKEWMELDLPRAKPWGLPSGVEHIIDCIHDPTKKLITNAEHARHVIEIMDKAFVAAREKRTVPLETTF
jgi:predicted dehydrogenase